MPEVANKPVYLVDANSDPVVVRIDGRACFQNSPCLRDFFTELLKQGLNQPVPVEEQVLVIFAGSEGYVDGIPVPEVQRYESEVRVYFRANHSDILDTIRTTGKLPEGSVLADALAKFTEAFDTGKGD